MLNLLLLKNIAEKNIFSYAWKSIMNIFYIPSWYPGKYSSYAGIFFKEQALAIGKLYSKNKIFINLWGHEDFALHPKRPYESLIKIQERYKIKSFLRSIGPNVWEIYEPRLSWSHKILKGNIANIILASVNNFRKIEKQFGHTDLIHAQVSFPAGYIAWKLSQYFEIPYVISEHMGPFPFKEFIENGKLSEIIRKPLKNARAISAVSPRLKKQMEKFGIRNIEVIPNMVDESFFRPGVKKKKDNTFVLFCLADITEEKGIGDLIQAATRIAEKYKNVLFRIGGSGENMSYYQKMAKSMGVEKYIKWLGRLSRDEVRKEFQTADAFILPSHFESFSMVIAEALVSGLPVIATRSGGPESMINKKNGLLVDVGDIKGMVENILKIMNNEISYESLKIRNEFLKKFSKKITADKIINIYKKTCAE